MVNFMLWMLWFGPNPDWSALEWLIHCWASVWFQFGVNLHGHKATYSSTGSCVQPEEVDNCRVGSEATVNDSQYDVT